MNERPPDSNQHPETTGFDEVMDADVEAELETLESNLDQLHSELTELQDQEDELSLEENQEAIGRMAKSFKRLINVAGAIAGAAVVASIAKPEILQTVDHAIDTFVNKHAYKLLIGILLAAVVLFHDLVPDLIRDAKKAFTKDSED